jgi:glycosyltransferase involved in cell wall biosynthesis
MTADKGNPKVTVVIPTYNCSRYITSALESVLGQSYRPIEVIVVDDGSSDDTRNIVAKFHEVKLIRQENGGPSKARNTGITNSQGEYIGFLDGDDLWAPGKLANQMDTFASVPQAALLFGDMRRFSDDGWTEPTMFQRYALTSAFFGGDSIVVDAVPKLLRMNFLPTGTVLARKRCLLEVGLFDEQLTLCEDWDLWLRVALKFPIAYSSRLWELKRIHSTNLSSNAISMAKAKLQVMEKINKEYKIDFENWNTDVSAYLCEGYRNLGYRYLRELFLAEARSAFIKSLVHRIEPRVILYWISTFLGVRVLGPVFRLRG